MKQLKRQAAVRDKESRVLALRTTLKIRKAQRKTQEEYDALKIIHEVT